MAEIRSVLITGASGFIGSHLTKALAAAGQDVHALVRKDSDLSALTGNEHKINLHTLDGSIETIISTIKSVQPELVYHLATHFLSSHGSADVNDLINANVLFGVQLLEAMDIAGVRRIVNAGTTWQHYQNRPYDPVNLYAATKQAFEDLLRFYTSARGFHAVTLELTDTYGPGDLRKKLFTLLQEIAQSGEKLSMSPGEQRLDLLYIDDVIRAFMHAGEMLLLDDANGFEKYLLAAAEQKSLRDVVQLFESLAGVKLQIQWGGRPYREREVLIPANQGKILPGWKPEINLEEGIKRMLDQKQVAN